MANRTVSSPERIAASVALGAATVVIVLTMRVVIESRDKLQDADALLQDGDTPAALDRYESAARAYAPGNPFAPAALHKMTLIAKAARMRGEHELSLHAWETVRRAIISTRHFFQPNEELLRTAEEAILAATSEASPGSTKASARVSRPEDPSVFGSVLIFAGLLLWIGGAAMVILSSERAPKPRRLVFWGMSLLGLATWIAMSWMT